MAAGHARVVIKPITGPLPRAVDVYTLLVLRAGAVLTVATVLGALCSHQLGWPVQADAFAHVVASLDEEAYRHLRGFATNVRAGRIARIPGLCIER
jgi:hypothetical protein